MPINQNKLKKKKKTSTNFNNHNYLAHIQRPINGHSVEILLAFTLIVINLLAELNLVTSSIVDNSGHQTKVITQHKHHFYERHHYNHYEQHKQPNYYKLKHNSSDDHEHRKQQQQQPQQQQVEVVANLTSSSDRKSGRQFNFDEMRTTRNRCLLAERELDRCSAQLIGLGRSSSTSNYPNSMQELNSVFCPKFRDTMGCIKNNTDCYRPFERQIISWILVSSRKMNHKRCKSDDEKVRFLRLTNSCFTSMKDPMNDCMTDYIGSLDAIADYNRDLERLSEDDVQIQLACCANMRFKQCVMNSAKQKCKSHDSLKKLRRTNSNSSQRIARKQMLRAIQGTMDDLRSTLDEMALTGPDFICNKIDDKYCKSTFDGRYTNRLPRHESIVPAMIKIYANK